MKMCKIGWQVVMVQVSGDHMAMGRKYLDREECAAKTMQTLLREPCLFA